MGCGRSSIADREEQRKHDTKVEFTFAEVEEMYDILKSFRSLPLTRGAHGDIDRLCNILYPRVTKYYREAE